MVKAENDQSGILIEFKYCVHEDLSTNKQQCIYFISLLIALKASILFISLNLTIFQYFIGFTSFKCVH